MPQQQEDATAKGVQRVLEDSDIMKPYWDKQHDHFWDRATTRITSTVGKWLMVSILAGGASALLVFAVRSGWIK